MSWKDELDGPVWVPLLNTAESINGIPADLLARVAYQESRFKTAIINGTERSPVGALGIMQLMPQYFQSVRVPIPFTHQDTSNQIIEAGKFLASLYAATGDWTLALAAYNAGLGNVHKYGGVPPFAETEKYVYQITADVPVGGSNV